MLAQSQAANPTISLPNNTVQSQLGGPAGEFLTAGLHGKYFTQCRRGNVFILQNSSSTSVFGQGTNNSQHFSIWNPAGSPMNVVPIKLQIGLQTVGVATCEVSLDYYTSAGAQLGTASPIVSRTAVTPICALLGYAAASVTICSLNSMATTPNSKALKSTGISQCMASTPTAANAYWQLTEYYDGELIVSPDTAISMTIYNVASSVSVVYQQLIWEEVPI